MLRTEKKVEREDFASLTTSDYPIDQNSIQFKNSISNHNDF